MAARKGIAFDVDFSENKGCGDGEHDMESEMKSEMKSEANENESEASMINYGKDIKDIASPARIPCISLKSFHVSHRLEFYKPIPIGESRTLQFLIKNTSYDTSNVEIVVGSESCSFISIYPSAIQLSRNSQQLITVTCQALTNNKIEETIYIKWDLHCINVSIHGIGYFDKNGGKKKKPLSVMLKEQKSVEMMAGKKRRRQERDLNDNGNDGNDGNEGKAERKEIMSPFSKEAMKMSRSIIRHGRMRNEECESPTLRKEHTFTQAPYSSPAPFIFKQQMKQESNDNNDSNEIDEPKKKKRRICHESIVINCNSNSKNKNDATIENMIGCKHERINYLKKMDSLLTIQSSFHCYIARKKCLKLIKIGQRQKRREKEKLFLQEQSKLQLKMQSKAINVFRMHLLTCRVRKLYLKRKESVITLQCAFHTYLAEKNAYYQMKNKIEKEENEKMEILKQERLLYLKKQECALLIQSTFRQYNERLKFKQFLHEKKMYLMEREKQEKMELYYKQECALKLYGFWKICQTKNEIKRYRQYRKEEEMEKMMQRKKQNEIELSNILKMQALARGKHFRLRIEQNGYINDVRQLQMIISNVDKANNEWKRENTINYRLNSALNKLLKSKTVLSVSNGCDDLESLLKVVPNIADRILQHKVIDSIFDVLRSLNRSPPHLKLVEKLLKFLLFFSMHNDKCFKCIFDHKDIIDVLTERLQIHRLDYPLFELTTQLLIIGTNPLTKEINSLQQSPFTKALKQTEIGKQMISLYEIMNRKYEMKRQVNMRHRGLKDAQSRFKNRFEEELMLEKCVKNMSILKQRL